MVATYSASASLEPDLPRLPVYLLNVRPWPRYAEFFGSKTFANVGSKPAETSLESMLEAARQRLSASGPLWPASSSTSAIVSSKKWLVMPVAPTDPISSLSTSRVTAVRAGASQSSCATRLV